MKRGKRLTVAKLHKRIADHRLDSLHKLTTYLTKNHSQVVIEDLNVSGMLKNKNLAKHIANGSFYEYRRQLEYKGNFYGCEIIVADRFFASSKTCSCCGVKNELLTLKDREWTCANCGAFHDRDFNAAVNLFLYDFFEVPIGGYADSSTVKASQRGEFCNFSHSPSVTQELNTKPDYGRFG